MRNMFVGETRARGSLYQRYEGGDAALRSEGNIHVSAAWAWRCGQFPLPSPLSLSELPPYLPSPESELPPYLPSPESELPPYLPSPESELPPYLPSPLSLLLSREPEEPPPLEWVGGGGPATGRREAQR